MSRLLSQRPLVPQADGVEYTPPPMGSTVSPTAYQDGEIYAPSPLLAYQELCVFRWCRALCKVTAPHTSVFGSPQVAQISEKMSTLPRAVTKCRLTEGIRRLWQPRSPVLTQQACW